MEFHRRRAPGGERAGRLAAGKSEGAGHAVGIESEQRSDGSRRAKWTDHTRAMPATRAEFWIIEAKAAPRRHLAASRKGGEQRAAGQVVALGNGEYRRNHFGRH